MSDTQIQSSGYNFNLPSANPKLIFIATYEFVVLLLIKKLNTNSTRGVSLNLTSNKTFSLITRKYEFAFSSEPPRVAILRKEVQLSLSLEFSPFK